LSYRDEDARRACALLAKPGITGILEYVQSAMTRLTDSPQFAHRLRGRLPFPTAFRWSP